MRQLYSATWLFSRVHDVALARFLLARAFVWVSLALAPGCSIQLTEKAPALRRRRIRLRLQSLALLHLAPLGVPEQRYPCSCERPLAGVLCAPNHQFVAADFPTVIVAHKVSQVCRPQRKDSAIAVLQHMQRLNVSAC